MPSVSGVDSKLGHVTGVLDKIVIFGQNVIDIQMTFLQTYELIQLTLTVYELIKKGLQSCC